MREGRIQLENLTRVLARVTRATTYDSLPGDVITRAKDFLFDTLGCALGGRKSPDPAIYSRVLDMLGGKEQATVIGSGHRTSLYNAALLNSLLARVLDFNDIYWNQDPSHPSDLIPVALSTGEYLHSHPREILAAIVIGYEIEIRLCDFARPGIRERGWHHATLTAIASPFVAGRLLGLSEDELVMAAGISASGHCTLGAVTAGKLTMMKNTVDPLAAAAGITAALLAKEGYTGPEHVLDGKEGLMQVLGEGWDRRAIEQQWGGSFGIERCSMKAYPSEALTHTPITALLELLRREKITDKEIAGITVWTIARAADILADPSKYHPKSKETADHSLPYCLAAAARWGRLGTTEFGEDRIGDPELKRLLPLVEVKVDPALEKEFPVKQPCRVEVRTVDGRRFSNSADYPKGHPRNPMTKDDLMGKFSALASPEMDEAKVEEVYNLVSSLDRADSIGVLLEALRVE